MNKRICPMILAVVSLAGSPAAGQEITNTDLFQLWNDCEPIDLVIDLSGDAKKNGLTKQRIQTMAESRLRSARIYSHTLGAHLYVNVNYADFNTEAGAFEASVSFNPIVNRDWSVDHPAKKNFATTWDNTYLGVSGGNSGFIMQTLSEQIDEFINEYLRVNAGSCN